MSEVYTGCRARFSLNGTKVGFATNVSLRETINYEPVDVLDDITTKEHAPTGYTVNMSASTVRIVNESIKAAGYFPKQGVDSAAFLRNIVTNGVLTATLQDSITGKTVGHVTGVRISERNLQVTARGIVGEDVTFVAIKARDESDLV
jgi:hypothetical protein